MLGKPFWKVFKTDSGNPISTFLGENNYWRLLKALNFLPFHALKLK